MKIILKETSVDYKTYHFGYAINAILENEESIEKAYSKGFLPYTNDVFSTLEEYYLARSIRINLKNYERLSENNRVIRKIDKKLGIEFKVFTKNEFDHSKDFKNFCINFSEERFSNKPLSIERLELILSRDNYNKIFVFYSNKLPIGYVLTYFNKSIIHYWFSFYETKFMKDFSLGKYIMEQVIYYAKSKKLQHVYLGTCYGNKALYKVRDFKGIEFYDGEIWNSNVKSLKEICKNDNID